MCWGGGGGGGGKLENPLNTFRARMGANNKLNLQFWVWDSNPGDRSAVITESYSDLLKRASLPTLLQRRLQKIATLMFKVKNGLVPHYISELFQTTPKGYNLRNADFNIPRISTTHYGKHSLHFFGPHLWGKLSPVDWGRSSLSSFKQSINNKDLTLLWCKNCAICS